MPKRYVLHGGYVRSTYDGDAHYVGELRLAHLYGLDVRECVAWYAGMPPIRDAVHLYPREDGRYRDALRAPK